MFLRAPKPEFEGGSAWLSSQNLLPVLALESEVLRPSIPNILGWVVWVGFLEERGLRVGLSPPSV